jgi:hypothetical protein
MITDVERWQRMGRGRTLQFFATDDEVQSWLSSLPERYEPYLLMGVDKVRAGSNYVDLPFHCRIEEFLECSKAGDGNRWEFWILSEAITPGLVALHQGRLGVLYSYSGLVRLVHGLTLRDCRDASSIGIVDKVINLDTGEVRQHAEYLEIFNTLRKTIKKDLRYSAIGHFPDGSQHEDTSLRLFTEGAVRAHEAGMLFTRTPGRPLRAGR